MRKFRKGLCRLFKDSRPLQERMYYAISIVNPFADTATSENTIYPNKECFQIFTAEHTETGKNIKVCIYEDGSYFSQDITKPHVFYKAIYGEGKLYIRPYDMFMSLADKKKYPQFKQKYRFEFLEDDYRYKPIRKNGDWNKFGTVSVDYYLGELRICVTAGFSDNDKLKINYAFDVADEHGTFGISPHGIYFSRIFTLSKSYVGIPVNRLDEVIINDIYSEIERFNGDEFYNHDLLREKAISDKKIYW